MNISWKSVIRDVVIIWILTAIGGFIAGVANPSAETAIVAYAFANLLLGSVGFCISGCMTPVGRWRHLFIVAIFVWLTSAVNMVFMHITVAQWILGIFVIFIIMGIGGALSIFFVRTPSQTEEDTTQTGGVD